jgi:predicted nucleotidyltransferase
MASESQLNRLAKVVRQARDDLSRLGLEWALVGGLAVAVRAEPRFTRDIDLAVAVADDREAERLIFRLQGLGYQVIGSLEQEVTGRLATIRLTPPLETTATVILDLLFASSGIEREVVANATAVEVFPGIVLPVASTGDLIALKLLARDDRHRPQDSDDLRALLREATDADIERVRESVKLLTQRGYHRDRDLVTDLERFLHQS